MDDALPCCLVQLFGLLTAHGFINFLQERCENILRSNPESRLTMELHLACIESKEQQEAEQLKKTAIGGAVAMGALGVAGAVASVLLAKR